MKLINRVCVVLLLIICSSCTQTNVIYDRYSLVEDVNAYGFHKDYRFSLSLPSYLNEGGIVLKTSDVSLRSANKHRWAYDLSEQLTVILNTKLKDANVCKDYSFIFFVNKFYGSVNGEVFVEMFAEVYSGNISVLKKVYSKNTIQTSNGYMNLVECLKTCFESVSDEFVNDVNKL
ncbi:MAG: ABC-type transport auxiliary lipoprotein family protein [Succinivibrio sp.]